MLLRARHYQTNMPLDVLIEDGMIVSLTPVKDVQVRDVIAPAYFDLQINGGLGINFTSDSLTTDEIARVVDHLAGEGVAGCCPTVITASSDTIAASFLSLLRARAEIPGGESAMPCFHLEGPFISGDDGPRGAHPREHVQSASWDAFRRWQDAAGGLIKLVTLAPEVPGALSLMEQLVKHGIVCSIGHSAASPSLIRDAISAGARLSTHLGNGCARQLPRHENLLWEQLAADSLTASIIPDGHHLPWTLVQCIERCKTLSRMIITCDSSPLAGLPAGQYTAWGSPLEITPEGKIVLKSQGVLAGSWDFTASCVEKYQRHSQRQYAEIHPLAADQPRKLLGLPVATLALGQPANLLLLQRNQYGILHLKQSLIHGRSSLSSASPLSRGGSGVER